MSEKKALNLKISTTAPKTVANWQSPWRILIVDDEADIHAVTRLIVNTIIFKNRPIELLHAYSASEARHLLSIEKNIAIVLLDVVMETNDAGLRLVQTIRNDLNNHDVRIILRTGQPGQAPEQHVVLDYDINDYKAKNELTAQKLFTTIIAALRAYETIMSLNKTRMGLEKILHSSDSLFKIQSMQEFASGVLTQLSSFLGCQPRGIICVEGDLNHAVINSVNLNPYHVKIVAVTDEFKCCLNCGLDESCGHSDIVKLIRKTLNERKSQFNEQYTVFYLDSYDNKATIALVHSDSILDEHDKHLLRVFTSKISIALANAIHYQKMISFEQASITDFLTGLYNRRHLLRLGLTLLTNAQRNHIPFIVAMLDIDYFKRINDSYGHDGGDIVLQAVSSLLNTHFRRYTDVVARYGGEEFCVLVTNVNKTEAFHLFDKFRIALENHIIALNNDSIKITVSIGISSTVVNNLDEMIARADKLLYQAKQAGRNCIMID